MDVVLDNLGAFADGFRTTLVLTALGFLLAFAIGLAVAAFRVSPVPPLRWVGATWTEVVRNIPLTVLFFVFFFGLPKVGLVYDKGVSAIIVLGCYTSAFVAETVRSGINAVPPGQAEAARALGLTFPKVLTSIVLPQALRTVVGPLGSLLIALTKNTSIALTIGVVELSSAYQTIGDLTARWTPLFVAAALAYLAITIPTGLAVGAIERRVAIRR